MSVTATLTWTPSYPGDTSQPPSTVDVLETAHAFDTTRGGSPGVTGSADDGLGDAPTYPGGTSANSVGSHLIHFTVSVGQTSVSLPSCSLSATLPNTPGTGDTRIPNEGLTYTVAIDTREVLITSSLGQTSHKSTVHFDSNGIALPDPDVPGSGGTTNANSVKIAAGDQETYEYNATVVGSWAANSSYLWHCSQGRMNCLSGSGTFTMPNDPPYYYGALYKPEDIVRGMEHVYIHLTDAGDGANATNNYYIQWHNLAENWQDHGAKSEISPKLFGTSDSAQPANGFDNVKIAPDEVDWSTASHVGGGIVTTAAGVLAVAQPETSPFVIGFLTAAGYTLSLATPPDPTIYTPQGTLAQFEADVNTQVQINNNNTTTVFMPGAQRMTPSLATTIATSGDYNDYFTGLLGPGFHFSVQVYRHRFNQNRVGDGYGTQGYYGQVSGTLTKSGSLEYVYNWN